MKRFWTAALAAAFFVCSAAMVLHPAAAAPARSGNAFLAAGEETTGPRIIDRFVAQSPQRERLIRAYTRKHYGREIQTIAPRAVVVHWTASDTADGVYRYFYPEARTSADGEELNVCSQFLVDKDGTIYRLCPETQLARHAIGYNWCAIGIENVGGKDGRDDLTDAQAAADTALILYLKGKYPDLRYVWGHYQQIEARKTGLYRELVPGYFSRKVDPGLRFMKRLQDNLEGAGLCFPAMGPDKD